MLQSNSVYIVHKKVHLVVCVSNNHGFIIEKAFRDKRKAGQYARKVKADQTKGCKRTVIIEIELQE